MANRPTALYLHGGPGLNSAIERAWLGNSHPVLWWDQPHFSADAKNAYQSTLEATAEKLAELHSLEGRPIHVIGWSFGTRLALDLAHRNPEAISALTLLAPTFCLETAFDRLARYLASKGAEKEAPLSPEPLLSHRDGNHHIFMERVMSVLSTPDLFSHYWSPTSGAKFARHSAEAARTEWFDLATFTAVSREVINRPLIPLPPRKIPCIRILAGQHDPYFDPETDFVLWKKLLPEATILTVDGAHMLPFETSVTEWLK